MTDLEKLLHHTMELTLALNKACQALSNALVQMEGAKETILRLQGEKEVLELNLREAREGRAVRQ